MIVLDAFCIYAYCMLLYTHKATEKGIEDEAQTE